MKIKKVVVCLLLGPLVLLVVVKLLDDYVPSSKSVTTHEWSLLRSSTGSELANSTDPGVLQDMRKCSLALGVSQEKLDSNQELLSLALKASLVLSSLQTVLPANEMIKEHQNPCWRTNYVGDSSPLWLIIHRFLQVKLKGAEDALSLLNVMKYHEGCQKPECVHCLPYFFIGGFPKCGTTSLADILNNHHQISPPHIKEPHWWSRFSLRDMSDNYLMARTLVYLVYFKTATTEILDSDKDVITYDGSQSTVPTVVNSVFVEKGVHTDYCALSAVLSRILPDTKFIIAMRNPVDALYSAFYDFHGLTMLEWPLEMIANAPLFFHNEVMGAIERFQECRTTGRSAFECDMESDNWGELESPLGSYIYIIHLVKWTQFYPLENFLFLKTEDLRRDPSETMNIITDFLSIDRVSSSTAKSWFSVKSNTKHFFNGGTYGEMMPETRKLLTEFYAPYNKQLADFLDDERYLWTS